MTEKPQTRRFYFGKERILVLGDSHSVVFRNWRFRLHMPRTRFELALVGGATVSGLDNPNSKTQARAKFDEALEKTEATKVVTLLGEVDTGFVIWYRAKKYGQSVDEMLRMALDNYEELLASASRKAPVIAISCPLPTIRDGQTWGEVANLRQEVDASQKLRTELTLQFNASVRAFAQTLGCFTIDLDSDCLDDNGLVASRLLNRNPLDHHYSMPAYASLLAKRLASLLSTGVGEHRPSASVTTAPVA